jgi:hypothetical protein
MDDDEFRQRHGLQQIELQHQRSVELLKAKAAFEHAALRPLLLLNGGALIVYLALFGGLRSTDPSLIDLPFSIAAMVAWVVGWILSFSAIACAYYSQKAFEKAQRRRIEALDAEIAGDERLAGNREALRFADDKRGHRFRKWATFLVVISLFVFVIGVGLAMFAVMDV